MTTPNTAETPAMRSSANRLRHAMTQLSKSAEQVHDLYFQWADAVRDTAQQRVGSVETDDVLADPIYARALDANPRELCRAVRGWCEQMTAELNSWRTTATTGASSRADVDARQAATAEPPDLDTTATNSAEGADL